MSTRLRRCRTFRSRPGFSRRKSTFDHWSTLNICRNESSCESVAMPLLEVSDLDKTFMTDGGAITALDRLSFSVNEHEFVSIVGPSGCGKSTFLHIVGGFEPATGGGVRLNGPPVGAPGPDRGM